MLVLFTAQTNLNQIWFDGFFKVTRPIILIFILKYLFLSWLPVPFDFIAPMLTGSILLPRMKPFGFSIRFSAFLTKIPYVHPSHVRATIILILPSLMKVSTSRRIEVDR